MTRSYLYKKPALTSLSFAVNRVWPPIVRWSDSAIRDLCISSYTEEYSYNRLIVKDSSKGDMLWFVLEVRCTSRSSQGRFKVQVYGCES